MQNVTRAEMCYYQHDVQQAFDVCERYIRLFTVRLLLFDWQGGRRLMVGASCISVRDRDPFNFRVIPVYVCTLVELGKKRELFQYAHQMVRKSFYLIAFMLVS